MLEILRTGDLCSLLGGILILLWLGHWFANDRQKRVGGVLAVLAFLAYAGYAWGTSPPRDAGQLFDILLRSLFASGFTLGLAWLVLPLVLNLWQFVRLALEASAARVQEWEGEERARRAAELQTLSTQEKGRKKAELEAEEAKKAEEERTAKQAEEEKHRAEEEQERLRQETDLRSQKSAAREHLREFYTRNEPYLEGVYARAELEAFIAAEMHDTLELPALWGVCLKKLTELRNLATQQRKDKRQEDGRRAVQHLRLKKLDAEIETCKEKIANAEKNSSDPALVEDERRGLLAKIRQLEEQKEVLHLNDGGEP